MFVTQAQTLTKRLFSTIPQIRNAIQHLKHRSLLEVKGPDASHFLQGLITNDINHLSGGVGSMFTMFLNIKGRILFDALIYKSEPTDVYWIECDSSSSSALYRHLKIYKVRRKVEICGLDNCNVHVLFNSEFVGQQNGEADALSEGYDKIVFPKNSTELKLHDDLLIFKDPRVTQLGFRIVSRNRNNVQNSLKSLVECNELNLYRKLRYTLGIGEGEGDLSSGSSFPLECNCDYLHGISFHKGCYIGQELTARTYHTGVIRKRLMPLFFLKIPTALPENNAIIHNTTNLGKLRGIEDNLGLGLLRINQALELGNISIANGQATVVKPFWWPIELPKEKLNHHHD
ncbi:putative transferase CAF17 homolog, mitochondrial [Euwallacea fornicatus]|uniref:putative transferase CAF17 homolog, mitochondrial n=1 Tax=Euwallacea fornicatus TaxID=995702 RepID=UPI00338D6020